MKNITMSYALEDIAKDLKDARERKGLSQRALSELSGVRQYQISKTENGANDLRLSSLIELARALDLDVRLVPRKAVPAVESVVRSSTRKFDLSPIHKKINSTLNELRALQNVYPASKKLKSLQDSLRVIARFSNLVQHQKALQEIVYLVGAVRNDDEHFIIGGMTSSSAEPTAEIENALIIAKEVRDKLAHDYQEQSSSPNPAYSLDGDEND